MATATGEKSIQHHGAGVPRHPNLASQTVVALTNANGTGDDTIADVGASFSQTTLNNNFRDVSDKINEILTLLQDMGLRN